MGPLGLQIVSLGHKTFLKTLGLHMLLLSLLHETTGAPDIILGPIRPLVKIFGIHMLFLSLQKGCEAQ